MRTINLKMVRILETTIAERSISILYQVLDDAGNIIINNRISVEKKDLPTTGQKATDDLLEKLLAKVVAKEL